ncbi:MAG: hypothetical protein LBQ66_09145 [Planctomycetaceae bacterium]|jgi:flagellar biogenesis protein FliO|nr:hypothetical protein [Planctomycetaceae bacterium]
MIVYCYLSRIIVLILLVSSCTQNINLFCPHGSSCWANDQFTHQNESQPDQYNYNQNQNNSNQPRAEFGRIISNEKSTNNELEQPIIQPKPLPNHKKNSQLNALRNNLNNTNNTNQNDNNPTQQLYSTNNPHQNITNSNRPSSIKFASNNTVQENTNQTNLTTTNHINNTTSNTTTNIPTTNTQDTQTDENYIAERNKKDKETDAILNQTLGQNKDGSGSDKLQKPTITGLFGPTVSVLGSLIIVISAFLIVALLFRKISPKTNQPLPKEAFESLGRSFLSQKLQVQLLRLGNRLILVSTTNDKITPITEITDPDEVVTIISMCRRIDPNDTNIFHQNLTSQLKKNSTKNKNNYTNDNSNNNYFGSNNNHENITTPQTTNQNRQKQQRIDIYNEPDKNSLAAILASGIERNNAR